MNEDILKGKWLEIRGRVKENWGKIIDNNLVEIEGRGQILLGLLQKKYGYISDKAEPEYQDTVELVEIVSKISGIMAKMKDISRAIAFIARYGRPLLAKNQESQIAGKEIRYGDHTDRYSYSRLSRRTTHLASQ